MSGKNHTLESEKMSDQNGGGSANGYVKTFLLGNLGGDPEMRYTPGGNPVTNFRMAINQHVHVDCEYIVPPCGLK